MKKKKENNDYPIPVGNQYVCSDGQAYSDMYFARQHEKSINNNNKEDDGIKQN